MASTVGTDGEERTRIMSAPLPVRAAPAAQRIEALDFVRGAALFGILLMNIVGFGLPDSYTNPNNAGGATGANLLVWIVGQIGVEGTQRALFSMLFGASTILLTSRLEASGRADGADSRGTLVRGARSRRSDRWCGDEMTARSRRRGAHDIERMQRWI